MHIITCYTFWLNTNCISMLLNVIKYIHCPCYLPMGPRRPCPILWEAVGPIQPPRSSSHFPPACQAVEPAGWGLCPAEGLGSAWSPEPAPRSSYGSTPEGNAKKMLEKWPTYAIICASSYRCKVNNWVTGKYCITFLLLTKWWTTCSDVLLSATLLRTDCSQRSLWQQSSGTPCNISSLLFSSISETNTHTDMAQILYDQHHHKCEKDILSSFWLIYRWKKTHLGIFRLRHGQPFLGENIRRHVTAGKYRRFSLIK